MTTILTSLARRLRYVAYYLGCVGCLGVAACSSPPSRFYTLSAPTSAATSTAQMWIDVPPIEIPAQVAKNQFVVHTEAPQVEVLEQERWASPLSDEIRQALSSDLMRQLDAVDVYGMPHANATPLYRVNVNVRRFDSWPGSRAMLDAVWSVRGLTCHTRVAAPAGVGFDALVIAHQHNLAQLSRDIATAIRALAASAPAACPQ